MENSYLILHFWIFNFQLVCLLIFYLHLFFCFQSLINFIDCYETILFLFAFSFICIFLTILFILSVIFYIYLFLFVILPSLTQLVIARGHRYFLVIIKLLFAQMAVILNCAQFFLIFDLIYPSLYILSSWIFMIALSILFKLFCHIY